MQDPKGGQLTESSHTVKTLAKALEWFDGVAEDNLPVTIEKKTTSDGRIHYKIIDRSGAVIYRRG
jgi:hypothetical protein